MRQPYLLQIIKIKSRDVGQKTRVRRLPAVCGVLWDWVDLEYMGSSEYEGNNWHKSIRRMNKDGPTVSAFIFEGRRVFIIGNKDKAQEYAELHLANLAKNEYRLKERINFYKHMGNGLEGDDQRYTSWKEEVLWHDIENDLAIALNPEIARIFAKGIPLSVADWDVQNARHAAKEKETAS